MGWIFSRCRVPAGRKPCPGFSPPHLRRLRTPPQRKEFSATPCDSSNDSWTTSQWRQYRWAYNRFVEKADRVAGDILESLHRHGLADSTWVIFTSDHGDMQGAHRLHQKGVLYEESCKVPLIISGPSLERIGAMEPAPVSASLDLYPTLCDLAGLPPPSHAVGQSLAPAAERPLQRGRPDGIFAAGEPNVREDPKQGARMVRSDRYKYIAYACGRLREQLFDLIEDPGEMVNLATDRSHRPALLRHRERLRRWLERTGDPFQKGHYAMQEIGQGKPMLPDDSFPAALAQQEGLR